MALTTRDLQLIRKIVNEEVKKQISTEVTPLKTEMSSFKNDLLQFKDDILGEIIKLREDMAVLTGYRGMIENHENRLEVVENHLGIPQA
jgi:hypothetical protein